MSDIKLNIIGKWDVSALTPFGINEATVKILAVEPNVSGTIVGKNGSLDFTNGIIDGNKLSFSATVDTPIKATLFADVEIVDDKAFSGTLKIDEYMTIDIRGDKNVDL
jgi:hypothetical protein